MNDENEFVQKVRFEVEDTELSASLDRFQAALGRAGETANREIDESLTKAASSANEVAKETANIGKEASSAAKETQKIYEDTDPLKIFREKAADEMNIMTREECDALDEECAKALGEAKQFAMDSPFPDANEYMKYVYVDD